MSKRQFILVSNSKHGSTLCMRKQVETTFNKEGLSFHSNTLKADSEKNYFTRDCPRPLVMSRMWILETPR
eukprot:3844207-Amphidinium_carterae.2